MAEYDQARVAAAMLAADTYREGTCPRCGRQGVAIYRIEATGERAGYPPAVCYTCWSEPFRPNPGSAVDTLAWAKFHDEQLG